MSIDPQLFEHALTNLLTNALKHTPAHGEVRLTTHIDLECLYISVRDSGKGIPKEYLARIFERYFQVDETALSQGMGIGLSYTRQIVEAHGFGITVTSEPGQFTHFQISIPLESTIIEKPATTLEQVPEKSQGQAETRQNDTRKNIRILVAEDNRQMRELLASMLQGYTLAFASNGKEALALLSREVFDLLVTDYAMPVMNGEELVEKVKSLNLKLPILVLTARADELAKRTMLRLGVDAYMTKPFLRDELINYIEKSIALMATLDQQQVALSNSEQKFLNDHATVFNQSLNEFIDKNMRSHNFSVENIAAHFNISKSTLNRRVKSLLGQTTQQIIMEARLQKARELYLTMPLARHKEIAEAVGIKNSTYLKKMMEKRFGETL